MADRIYLDTITAAKPSSQALQVQIPYYEEFFASPSSPHQAGQELSFAIKKEYTDLYELFGAKAEDRFVFTSSGAEAVSQIAHSVFSLGVKIHGKNHFICRAIDEAAPIMAFSKLEEEACSLTLAAVSLEGYMKKDALIDACTPRTAVVSCSWVSALTAVIQPIEEIAALCKQRGILFHLDATHAIGKLPINFSELPCDYLSFNGEQFHSPKGTGGFFAKPGAPIVSLIHGEDEDRQYRGVALNMPLFVALVQASRESKELENMYCTEVARLRNRFEEAIVAALPDAKVLFQNSERVPHISCISFPGVKSELLALLLSRKGVYGCMGGGPFQQIERVLDASGIEKPYSQCALSFSLSKDTQESEIERAVVLIVDVVKRAKRTSKIFFSS